MSEPLVRILRKRAGGRCEYCHLPDRLRVIQFEIELIIPVQHGGSDALGNLAYACYHCNRNKGPNLSGIDRTTSLHRPIRLFHPRLHQWNAHFVFVGQRIVGKTAIGRVTIEVLKMNSLLALNLREEIQDELNL